MKRLLLFLICVLTLFGVSQAEEKTIKITTTETKAANNSSSYVTTPTNVTVDGFIFVFDEFNPSNGQMRVNNTGLSGFNLCNSTAISGLKSIKITSNQSTLGTWYVKTGNSTKITSAATASDTKGIVNTSNTNNTVTFDIPSGSTYFMLNLTEKGSGNVYFTSIEITYEDVLQDLAPSNITFSPDAESINTNTQISISADGTNPTITYSIDGVSYNQTYSVPFTLPEGTHTIYAKAWNDANKETPITASATYNVIFEEKPEIPGEGSEFELVTSTDYLEAGKYYVIAFKNTNYYALGQTESNSRIQGSKVNVLDNILTAEDNTAILKLNGTEKNWNWEVVNGANVGKYLYWPNDTKSSYNNTPLQTSVSFDQSTGNAQIQSNETGVRYIMGYSSNDFRAYLPTGTSNGIWPNLYRLVEAKVPALPVVTIGEETLENGRSKTVLAGTDINITCKDADKIVINGEENDFVNGTYTYIINKSGKVTIQGRNEEGGDGPEFTYTFNVDTYVEFPGKGSNFRQIIKAEELTDGYYVIARVNGTEDESVNYAMSTIPHEQRIPSTTNISATAIPEIGSNSGFNVVKTLEDDVLVLYLENKGESNGITTGTIKTANFGDKFKTSQCYLKADGSYLKLSNEESEPTWTINLVDKTNNVNITSTDDNNKDRSIKYNTGNYFNCAGNYAIQLYKLTNKKPFVLSLKDVGLQFGKTETYKINLPEERPNIKFTIDGDCISLEETTITPVAPGEATITASWEEDDNWFGGSVSFNVTVRYPAELSFRHGTDPENPVLGKKGVGVLSQAVYYTGDGTITYSIEKYIDGMFKPTDDIAIEKTTGMIRVNDIVNADVNVLYKVTAHVVGDVGSYVEDDAVYYIKIEAPEEGYTGNVDEIVISFGDNGPSVNNFQHWSPLLPESYDDSKETATYRYVKDGINMDFDIKYAMITQQSNYYFIQLNNLINDKRSDIGSISFSIPEGCEEIEFKVGTGSAKDASVDLAIDGQIVYQGFLLNSGSNTYKVSSENCGKIIKITPNTSTPKIAKITFKIPEKDTEKASNLSFPSDSRVYNRFVDELITISSLNHNDELDFSKIEFNIDEIEEEEQVEDGFVKNYELTRDDLNEQVNLVVHTPGVYTFRAYYNGPEFLNGMAILRLNVFPRLAVEPTQTTHDGILSTDYRTDVPELTLVEPAIDESGNQSANIKLPTLDELLEGEDGHRYTTISVSKVEIVEGDEHKVYSENEEEGEENIANLPTIHEFKNDGSITYWLKYANTEDFMAPMTVHVVMMPQTPVADESQEGKVTLTPSVNSKLQIARVYGNASKGVKRGVVANEEWKDYNSEDPIIKEDEINNGVTKIYYRSIKDLSDYGDLVNNNAILSEDPILASEEDVITLAATKVTANIKVENMPFDTSSSEYDLSQVLSFINSDDTAIELTEGTDFEVKIEQASAGWASTTATDIAAAYQAAFANIQGEETGLYDQYTLITGNKGLVDGFFTSIGTPKATADSDNQYNISVTLPCSGVYKVTVSPVEGSEYTFDVVETTFSVTPNFMGVFGEEQGFNIEGFGAQDNSINIGEDFIKDNLKDGELKDFICYIPGTYFADKFTVEVSDSVNDNDSESGIANGVKRHATNNDGSADASNYFSAVSMPNFYQKGEVNDKAIYDVDVTVTKNGATSTKTYTVRIGTPFNSTTGVDEIEAVEAEAEYFNLQGLKIKNPERGQIYIKVVGNKATKVIM